VRIVGDGIFVASADDVAGDVGDIQIADKGLVCNKGDIEGTVVGHNLTKGTVVFNRMRIKLGITITTVDDSSETRLKFKMTLTKACPLASNYDFKVTKERKDGTTVESNLKTLKDIYSGLPLRLLRLTRR